MQVCGVIDTHTCKTHRARRLKLRFSFKFSLQRRFIRQELVFDSFKVVKTYLSDAVSLAGLVLATECLVVKQKNYEVGYIIKQNIDAAILCWEPLAFRGTLLGRLEQGPWDCRTGTTPATSRTARRSISKQP